MRINHWICIFSFYHPPQNSGSASFAANQPFTEILSLLSLMPSLNLSVIHYCFPSHKQLSTTGSPNSNHVSLLPSHALRRGPTPRLHHPHRPRPRPRRHHWHHPRHRHRRHAICNHPRHSPQSCYPGSASSGTPAALRLARDLHRCWRHCRRPRRPHVGPGAH